MSTSGTRARRRFSDNLKRKLSRDQGYKCMYCGRKRAFVDLEVDHKTPVQRGGSDSVGNLQVLCAPCNKRKGNQTDAEFRRRYKSLLPAKAVIPERAIRQDEFDMITATTNRPAGARQAQGQLPGTVDHVSARRIPGWFSDTVEFQWQPPARSATSVDGYQIQYRVRKSEKEGEWRDPDEGDNITDPGYQFNSVPQDIKVSIRIRAMSGDLAGPWSKAFREDGTTSTESAKRQANGRSVQRRGGKPNQITHMVIKRDSGFFSDTIRFAWRPPESRGGSVAEYHLQYRVHGPSSAGQWVEFNNPHTGTDEYYEVHNVDQSLEFSVRIRARNTSGWGPWSKPFVES